MRLSGLYFILFYFILFCLLLGKKYCHYIKNEPLYCHYIKNNLLIIRLHDSSTNITK